MPNRLCLPLPLQETAMGSAIECFDDADAVVVPRSRFAPVKTCNDLFALRSGGSLLPLASAAEVQPVQGSAGQPGWHSGPQH